MSPLETSLADRENTTVGLPKATSDFLTFAAKFGLAGIASSLVDLSLNKKQPKFLGGILCFLKQPNVIKLCKLWGDEEFKYIELGRLGEIVCHDSALYKAIGEIDYSIPVATVFRGDIRECYLATLLACASLKDPEVPPPSDQARVHPNWAQAIRLWVLGTALDANDAGFVSESHLKKFAGELRNAIVGINADLKQESFQHLSFADVPSRPSAFQTQLQLKATEYLSRSQQDNAVEIDADFSALIRRHLSALFNQDFEAAAIPEGKHYGTHRLKISKPPATGIADDSWYDVSVSDAPDPGDIVQRKVADLDHVISTRSDPDSTPEEQEQASGQVLLLSREDGLMLPWSWHRLSETEKPAFFKLISNLRSEKNFTANLAAAIATVAVVTAQSGRQVEKVQISDQPSDAWALHPQKFSLSRRPPRKSNGWTPKDLQSDQIANWLVPTVDHWLIELHEETANTFAIALKRVADAKTIGSLWEATGEKGSFSDWFNLRLAKTPELARITAPILATIARQEVFVKSRDHVLARVVTSSPSTALPGAAAYGAYSGNTVFKAFTPLLTTLAAEISAAHLPLNWAGSQLEVLEEYLKERIQDIEHRIDEISKRHDSWVEYHNLLVSYVVLLLLSVTGGRPVNSPFESIRWFDFKRKLVFVDDKVGGMARASRLCILTDEVIDILLQRYLPHLKNMAQALREKVPDFAAQIDSALAGNDKASLPLFFFMSNEPSFDWLEVTETGLAAHCGVKDLPIPINFLRHRFSTRLRKEYLDIEIIEALMGHGDAGCESHGAYSLRVLSDDLAIARPLVAKITNELQWRMPSECAIDCHSLKLPRTKDLFSYTRKFGNKARALQRRSDHERIRQIALADISRALNGRDPKTLSAEDWDQIGLRMVVNENSRLPQSHGALRYDVFQQYLRTIWKEFGIKPKIKRRFLFNREGTPTISEKSIYAPALVARLREQFEVACANLEKTAPGPMVACMLASLDACLNSNIADHTVLISVACHANVNPVHFRGGNYIDHYTGTKWKDGHPARRFPVTGRCIRHLLTGLGEGKARHKIGNCPPKLAALPALLGLPEDVEFGKLLTKIAALVAETNCYGLSGLQAAILDGRIHVSALPHHDWIRSVKLERPTLSNQPDQVRGTAATNESLITNSTRPPRNASDKQGVDKARACRSLFRAIRSAIASNIPTSKKCTKIQTLLDESIFDPGDLPYALGEWASYNLIRPASTKSKLLQASSVETYFNDLAGRVSSVASGQQLSECDDDELLELYRSLLQPPEAAPLSGANFSSIGSPGVQDLEDGNVLNDEQGEESQKVDGAADATVIQQLLDFHEWAAPKFGLDDPDFSELGEFDFVPVGRPGFVLKSEYLWCLRQLTSSTSLHGVSSENLSAAMVAVLAYRFGLRSREAMGIYRSDWVDISGALVVLVQSNYVRGLKNLQSKRQVPRLEPFTPLEKAIAEEVLRRWDLRQGENQSSTLLAELNPKNFKHFCIGIRARLLRLLKAATGNPRTNIHHLRHSFACRTLAGIAGNEFELGVEVNASQTRAADLRKLLLCHDSLDRRAIWAVCRLMGHSSPATLLKAYFHGQTLPIPIEDESFSLDEDELNDVHLVNLDKVDCNSNYLPPVGNSGSDSEQESQLLQTLESRVNYLRLRAIGFHVARAAYTVGMPILTAYHFEAYVATCVTQLIPAHKGEHKVTSLDGFSRKIAASRWKTLLEVSRKRKDGSAIILIGSADKVEPQTIGSHRHLVFFRNDHLKAFAEFCADLDLLANEIRLLRTEKMPCAMTSLHQALGLEKYSKQHPVNAKNAARISSVSASLSSDDQQQVRFLERWGAYAEPGRRFSDNVELIALWMCWACRADTGVKPRS